jgi:8-amino-3,8-dideoxy-alpha-D-manno-octulosonate transaminase
MHDQGHAPDRLGSKYATRPFLGMNLRMTELSGAVLLAQLRRLETIRTHLRANKAIVKSALADLPGLGFRTMVDPEGDLATHCVVVLPTADIARDIAAEIGSITLDKSGWHVYANMEHVLERRTVTGDGWGFDGASPAHQNAVLERGMLPRTDELLSRSISFGIGVFDTNLAPFGLRMRDDADTARAQAARFHEVAIRHLAAS